VSPSARLATTLLLAIHLAASSAPCPNAKLPHHEPESGALSGGSAHPCPGHADTGDSPSVWFDSLCPCGCETALPGGVTARTGPALLLAELAALCAPDRDEPISAPLQLTPVALAPPDHVPLSIV